MRRARFVLLSIIFMLVSVNTFQAFAATESFSVPPDAQKAFDVTLQENHKVFFQIFVNGGENNDIRLKIINKDTNFVDFDSIIRASSPNADDPRIFPAYKNEISNDSNDTEHWTVIFDNSLSTHSSKKVDFTYTVFTGSGEYFEENAFWSWVFALVIIVISIIIVIMVIAIIIKKRKYR